MTKDAIIKWAREHKKELAEELIRSSGAQKSEQPAAIFMAGLPGSGKTEVSKGLIKSSGLKVVRLDMDEIAMKFEGYEAQKADEFRRGASMVLTEVFDKVIKSKYNFIMDGTFGGSMALQNIERTLKRGYDVKVVYVQQNPQVAWKYTRAREKVEHRAIELDGFVDSYFRTVRNLSGLSKFSDVTMDVIIKDERNGVKEWRRNVALKDIDRIVKVEYNDKNSLKEKLYV